MVADMVTRLASASPGTPRVRLALRTTPLALAVLSIQKKRSGSQEARRGLRALSCPVLVPRLSGDRAHLQGKKDWAALILSYQHACEWRMLHGLW